MFQSKALEVNIAESFREVSIDPKYAVVQEVMSKYYGIMEGLNTFLTELSHPLQNWQFIIKEARTYSLNYFHLLKSHPKGDEAALLLAEVFIRAIEKPIDPELKADAADNLLLFIQKIIKESGRDILKFTPVLNQVFARIGRFSHESFFLFVKSFYQPKKVVEGLLNQKMERNESLLFTEANRFMIRYFQHTYSYWLSEGDPLQWFEKEAGETDHRELWSDLFYEISHERIQEWNQKLTDVIQNHSPESGETLKKLMEFPSFGEMVEIWRETPQKLLNAGNSLGNHWKMLFLLNTMNIPGLSRIHEETLRDINRTLSWLIENENYWKINHLIEKTFAILKSRTAKYPATALNCVLNMGHGIYKTRESDLVKAFLDSVVGLGFQTPMISGVGYDWKVKVNQAHIQNIRTWLELIEINPKGSVILFSDLIIHLSLTGVYIKDTDLFPRDITKLLNSPIAPVYNLVKQLTRLFPTYFNDIGAEGELREVSTRFDELCRRKDVLVHFLRKQSHVESSNYIIGFMEETIRFWKTLNKIPLAIYMPPDIYQQIEAHGPYIDGVHRAVRHLEREGLTLPDDLLKIHESELKRLFKDLSGVSDRDTERVILAANFYKLLYQKYNLAFGMESKEQIAHYLDRFKSEAFPDTQKIKDALAHPNLYKKISLLLDYLEQLKGIILSEKIFDVREDIYNKRHFTVDIPSMYGSYHEKKFDALGLTFRIEAIVNVFFEELIQNFDFTLITKATFSRIYDLLTLFDRALKLDGIVSAEMERQLDLLFYSLEVRGFTFTQYIDIFKGFVQGVRHIIHDCFHNIHGQNLNRILSQTPMDELLPKYLSKDSLTDPDRFRHRVSEIFFRDRIATSLGLQQLDLFLLRIMKTLYHQAEKLPKDKLHQLLLYDPERAMLSVDKAAKAEDSRASGIVYLGNKAYNLVKLKNFGLPIPPAFIITTEVFRCRNIIAEYPPAQQNFRDQIALHIREMEKITGKLFGNPSNPLLFSVRSGASISQPGMMDTFLNVGMNEEIAAGLAAKTGNTWFAWDCYRRFLQCYGMSYDLNRDMFDAIIQEHKDIYGYEFKRDFSGEQMKDLALAYKDKIRNAGIELIEKPFEQLIHTIEKVFLSWDSPKAVTYRRIMGISDDWGTAVTVQAMVFGNLSRQSGTGVFFTHNPKSPGESIRLWGDFTRGNQGEDVVSGLVNTMPISMYQQEYETRQTDVILESYFPEIYQALKHWATELVEKMGWGPQEIEFTFESPSVKDLYLLQTRDMAMRERKRLLRFEPEDLQGKKPLGHGIGVSGGAMSGRAVFTLEEIDRWRIQEPDMSLILLRGDTVPDDIREIHAADGLLTARGGMTSHAAVVAHRLDKTCVVGCGNFVFRELDRIGMFGSLEIRPGDYISIDGQEGAVYEGFMRVRAE